MFFTSVFLFNWRLLFCLRLFFSCVVSYLFVWFILLCVVSSFFNLHGFFKFDLKFGGSGVNDGEEFPKNKKNSMLQKPASACKDERSCPKTNVHEHPWRITASTNNIFNST